MKIKKTGRIINFNKVFLLNISMDWIYLKVYWTVFWLLYMKTTSSHVFWDFCLLPSSSSYSRIWSTLNSNMSLSETGYTLSTPLFCSARAGAQRLSLLTHTTYGFVSMMWQKLSGLPGLSLPGSAIRLQVLGLFAISSSSYFFKSSVAIKKSTLQVFKLHFLVCGWSRSKIGWQW